MKKDTTHHLDLPPLTITEETADEIVRVIKTGLHRHPILSSATVSLLLEWCRMIEEDIHSIEHPDEENPYRLSGEERI